MASATLSNEEIARLGTEVYERKIRSQVLPQHKGKFLALDIDTGDYEVDEDDVAVEHRLRARRPHGVFFVLRIGYTTAYTMNGPFR